MCFKGLLSDNIIMLRSECQRIPGLLHNISHISGVLYLHGEGGSLLVVMVQYVGHEGGVVGQPLAHAQGDGLTGEQAVAPRRRVHGDGDAHRQHGHGQHPQEIHDRSAQQRKGQGPRGRLVRKRG